jgi:hypothetical protein
MTSEPFQTLTLLPSFGPTFMEDHARRVVGDPRIALAEIIANSWDAGADRVDVTWPQEAVPDLVEIVDNGTGMTYEQFTHRWLQLNYNRTAEQGEVVAFPTGNHSSHRKSFGRNGKGRHSAFCFANTYNVETWRDGEANRFLVEHTTSITNMPYMVTHIGRTDKAGHGTRISAELVRNYLPVPDVRDLIGSKFVTDPTFVVYVNGELVDFTDLANLIASQTLDVPGVGVIRVSQVDTQATSKTSLPHGVAWWVNHRLVGEPSWQCVDENIFVDRRSVEAKRYTFVVEADCLVNDVEVDWSDFRRTERVIAVQQVAGGYIEKQLIGLMREVHMQRKRLALAESVESLRGLPIESQYLIGQVVDGIQGKIPTVQQRVLSTTVSVLAGLEQERIAHRKERRADPDVAAVLAAPRQHRLPVNERG